MYHVALRGKPRSASRRTSRGWGPAVRGEPMIPRRSTMRYGFYLPTRSATATPDAIEALVLRGEALGFSSVVIADHLVFPVQIASRYPYTVSGDFPGDGDALDQLSLMAF